MSPVRSANALVGILARDRPKDGLQSVERGRLVAHPRLPSVVLLLIIAMSAQLIVKAPTLNTTMLERIAFGGVVLVSGVAALSGILAGRRTKALSGVLGFWTLLMLLELTQYLIPAAGQRGTPPADVLTDFFVMLLPGLLALALSLKLQTRRQITILIVTLVIVAMVAALISWGTNTPGLRFRAPPNIAIAGAWALTMVRLDGVGVSHRAASTIQRLGLFMVVSLVPVILGSQSRTALVAWLLCGAFSMVMPGVGGRRRLKWAMLALFCVSLAMALPRVGPQVDAKITSAVGQTRLVKLTESHSDVSTEARVLEVKDVIATMENEGSGLDRVLGFGHGASYDPSTSLMAVNTDPRTNRVHNVHNTLGLVYLRYGIVGLVGYVLLLCSTVLGALREFVRSRDMVGFFLVLASGVFILDALVRNSFADPTFALVIAAVAVCRRLSPEVVR